MVYWDLETIHVHVQRSKNPFTNVFLFRFNITKYYKPKQYAVMALCYMISDILNATLLSYKIRNQK